MNKKAILFAITIIMSSIILPISAKSPNQIMLTNPDYVLNILGKEKFTDNPMTDSPDRHTIFVPLYDVWTFYISQVKRGSGDPFQVLDANAVVDGEAAIMLGDGYYSVWIAGLGKPGGSTSGDVSISGMVNLGTIQVERAKGTPDWNEETSVFFMTEAQIYDYFFAYYTSIGSLDPVADATSATDMAWSYMLSTGLVWYPEDYDFLSEPSVWVFDFFDYLVEVADLPEAAYYWAMDNNGLRHMQLRFYKVKNRNFEWILPEI